MKTVLYILHFQESNLIKIGYTKNISNRITAIEKGSQLIVDHHKSLVITYREKDKIVLLERNLLHITSDFGRKMKVWNSFAGINEFRTNNCCNLLNQFIEDQKGYGIKYKIYKGIDICGNYSHLIPKAYYPVYYPVKGMPKLLKEDALKFCEIQNIKLNDLINLGIYKFLKCQDLDRSDDVSEKYKNYFKA
ncbi:hypothetical protein [Nonlabens sp. Asnod3-A02]|uniref:hypothetical protein n=1 Tax=Nonlabens sp. Asnod3-A02 TaxID=3160579 RepID=UPI00386B1094